MNDMKNNLSYVIRSLCKETLILCEFREKFLFDKKEKETINSYLEFLKYYILELMERFNNE